MILKFTDTYDSLPNGQVMSCIRFVQTDYVVSFENDGKGKTLVKLLGGHSILIDGCARDFHDVITKY